MDMKVHTLCDELIDHITSVRHHCDNGTRDIGLAVISELRDALDDLEEAVNGKPVATATEPEPIPHILDAYFLRMISNHVFALSNMHALVQAPYDEFDRVADAYGFIGWTYDSCDGDFAEQLELVHSWLHTTLDYVLDSPKSCIRREALCDLLDWLCTLDTEL